MSDHTTKLHISVKIKELKGFKRPERFSNLFGNQKEETSIVGWKSEHESLKWSDESPVIFSGVQQNSKIFFHFSQVHRHTGRSSECHLKAEKELSSIPLGTQDILLLLQPHDTAKLPETNATLMVSITVHQDLLDLSKEIRVLGERPQAGDSKAAEHIEAFVSGAEVIRDKAGTVLEDWTPLLDKIDKFVEVAQLVSGKSLQLHPWAHLAASVILAAYNVWKDQRERDASIEALVRTINEHCRFIDRARPLDKIKSQSEILHKFMMQIIECAQFIHDYGKEKVSDSFDEFKKAFEAESQLQTQLTVVTIQQNIEQLTVNLTLQDLPFADGARYESGKGSREGILQEILDWAFSAQHQERILLLTGPAGSGKSAIANTAAKSFDELGRLGSSFCFDKNSRSRTISLFFSTVASDLADYDPQFKRFLAKTVQDNRALKKTHDIKDQLENFIAIHRAQWCHTGPTLVVLDALDEAGNSRERDVLLQSLSDPKTIHKLPPNVRLFITARREPDIIYRFRDQSHVRILDLSAEASSEASSEALQRDMYAFVHYTLIDSSAFLPDDSRLTEAHCHKIVEKAQGIFQWAVVVCRLIKETSLILVEELDSFLARRSNDLTNLYEEALRRSIPVVHSRDKEHFQLIVGLLLAACEPLPFSVWKVICHNCGQNTSEIEAAMKFVIPRIGALFNGGTSGDDGLIVPIHASVREYLTDPESGDYYVDQQHVHTLLARATLVILNSDLRFNMCSLQSSYTANRTISGLKNLVQSCVPRPVTYSCQFLGIHYNSCIKRDSSLTGKETKELSYLVATFLEQKLFYWLEVLGLLGSVDNAYSFLSSIIATA
ncbi:hypothetical protein M422DRAFT_271332 [Sphaerobolus stellatus SS14]|uniref:AAA+ ATPase domain-containing protein n=1 Tax=Sphaerobolus stellatus (strain SS14) TaxID=990650 RepID=A0A0C9UQ69_SPHS4|nr:hypothetical protein M422DRAFT_271332 [Sphaerobolus stellatus SS14]